jgi:hypothetical protein
MAAPFFCAGAHVLLHFRLFAAMWGRLLTGGRLAIGLPRVSADLTIAACRMYYSMFVSSRASTIPAGPFAAAA